MNQYTGKSLRQMPVKIGSFSGKTEWRLVASVIKYDSGYQQSIPEISDNEKVVISGNTVLIEKKSAADMRGGSDD